MISKIMKCFFVSISLAIIIRLLLSNDKTMIAYACVSLFLIPAVYTKNNNIVVLSKALEEKLSILFNKIIN